MFSKGFFVFFIVSIPLLVEGCAPVKFDPGTAAGKQAIIDATNLALSVQDCNSAVRTIEPLYKSSSTDNDVRMIAASAYACDAKINFFKLVTDVVENSAALAGPLFWQTMAKFFPSSAGSDYVVEGANLAIDALQAALIPGALVLPTNTVNLNSANPGSVFATDRTIDSNTYLVFVAMAGIGGSESRFGAPNGTDYKKSKDLKWKTAILMDTDGCTYAASILNFIDAIGRIRNSVNGAFATTLGAIHDRFSTVLNTSCNFGCLGTAPTGDITLDPKSVWTASGCAITAGCATCPSALRDRTRCSADVKDPSACAAAGIVNFINSSTLGWQGP